MIKIVFNLKRKPGMTREAFIERYENRENGHALLAESYIPEASRYFRRYLQPVPDLFTGETVELAYDVITEVWFENQEKLDAALARLSQPEAMAAMAADEDEIFDRPFNRTFMVEERESVMGS